MAQNFNFRRKNKVRKVTFFAVAAGAGVLFTGCVDDVMRDRHYIPAPIDNVPVVETTPVEQQRIENIEKTTKPVAITPSYEPMTDAVSSGGVDSASAAAGSSVSGKGVYIVKRGDYPERIARKNNVRLSDLMKANNLNEASARKLQIGQKLVIPDKKISAKSSGKKIGKKSADSGKNASAPALNDGKYTVKKGDSPERIARRFKVKVSDLMKANNLDEAAARRLQVGQKLVIPGKSGAAVSTADTPWVEKPTPVVTGEQTAPKNAPAVTEQTKEENSVDTATSDDTTAIELTKDMTWAEISAEYNVPEPVLRKLNVGIEGNTLTKDSLVIIPAKK